jgi:Ribbon-helix-helix protein, copG family
MGKSISVDVKKRSRGRPATGTDPEVSARVPPEVRDKIDNWAQANKCTRSEAIRQILELGLAAAAKRTRKPKAD